MSGCLIIVDNSNVFIEGAKFAAKQKGIGKSDLDPRDPQDPSWRVSFDKLLTEVSEGQDIIKAILVGSRPPSNDKVWDMAEAHGFTVTVHDRNSAGKEKAVDTELVAQGTEIICTEPPGILKLLSGDRDFLPLVNIAAKRGWETEMWAFSSAFTSHGLMAQTVMRSKPLDEYFDKISRYAFDWPTS
jgi:uncharacterized LabA/DUF88 family protein